MKQLFHGWIVFALICFSLLPCLTRDFSTRGEPREALVVSSMVTQAEYILPTVYGGDIPSKPPFLHWCGVITSLVFGDSIFSGFSKVIPTELSVRLPSLLAASLFAAFLYTFLLRYLTQETALVTVLILATLPEWLRSSLEVRVDMVFATTLAASLFVAFGRLSRVYVLPRYVGWFLLGAAFLAKGPVSIILFSAVVGLYALVIERQSLWEVIREVIITTFPAAIFPALWYVAAYQTHPELFMEKVFYENIARFSGTMEDEPHKHGIFYLLGACILGTLPWIGALIVNAWKHRSVSLTKLQYFCLVTIAVVVVFFAIPSSKRGVYLIPMYPALSVLVALSLAQVNGISERWLFFVARLTAIVVIAVGLYNHISLQLWITIALGFVTFVFVTQKLGRSLSQTIAVVLFILGSIGGVVGELYGRKLSPKSFSHQIVTTVAPSVKLFSFENEFYSIAYYSGRQLWRFDKSNPPQEGVVLVFSRDQGKFKEVAASLHLAVEELVTSSHNVIQRGQKITAYHISAVR